MTVAIYIQVSNQALAKSVEFKDLIDFEKVFKDKYKKIKTHIVQIPARFEIRYYLNVLVTKVHVPRPNFSMII